jgi:hypothetical protein
LTDLRPIRHGHPTSEPDDRQLPGPPGIHQYASHQPASLRCCARPSRHAAVGRRPQPNQHHGPSVHQYHPRTHAVHPMSGRRRPSVSHLRDEVPRGVRDAKNEKDAAGA